ncbi:hypothetical protein BGZ83_009550 [Gryganskiella cystojenkinii]|nr:hypothetical protein BGZ83_009550 [Gryganskiella cystojenkinii]
MSHPGTEGPVIHHRNSIAGTTLPHPVVRSRRAGSLAAVEDGPYFANTRQFHNVYSMDQTQSYKFRVMARIDRGFFTASKIWTCYRRNYFQISTAFNILGFDYARDSEVPCLLDTTEVYPRDPEDPDGGHIHGYKRGGTNTGHLSVVTHFSVCISSKISSSDKKIDLIQHTPKRDKGPQNVPGLRQIKGGGALTVLSDPSSPSGSSNGSNHNSSSSSTSTTPQSVVTYERVQFKTATANNGKRQAAQQFYILLVDLYAHTENGDIYCVASSQSDALVVRGRSPGHYVDLPERSLSISSLSGLEGTIGGAVVTPTSSHVASPGERRFSNVSQHGNHPYYYHHHHQHSYSTPHSRTHSISAGVGSMSIDVSSSPLSGLFGPAGVAARERRMTGGPLSPLTPLSPMSPAAIDGFGNQSEVSSAGGTLIGGTPTTVNNDDKYSPGVVGVTGEASSAGLNPAQSYFQYPTYQAWTEQEQLHGPLRHYQHSNSQQSLHRHFHGQHQQIPIGDPSLSTTSSNYDYDSSSFSSPTTPYPTGYSTSYPTTPFSGIPVNHSSTIGSVGPTVAAAMNGGLSSAVANTTVSESIAAGTPYPHWNGYPH